MAGVHPCHLFIDIVRLCSVKIYGSLEIKSYTLSQRTGFALRPYPPTSHNDHLSSTSTYLHLQGDTVHTLYSMV